MAWVAVDREGDELIFRFEPERKFDTDYFVKSYWGWYDIKMDNWGISLPKGTIKKLIGKDLDWSDEPVELKEE